MKLLLCVKCNEIFSLAVGRVKSCKGEHVSGQYLEDGLIAEVEGNGYVLGIANRSLAKALTAGDLPEGGRPFDAFVIPDGAPTVVRRK
jgi:hypothetical protein